MYSITATVFLKNYFPFLSKETSASVSALDLCRRENVNFGGSSRLSWSENLMSALDLARCVLCHEDKSNNLVSLNTLTLCKCENKKSSLRNIFEKEYNYTISAYAFEHLGLINLSAYIFTPQNLLDLEKKLNKLFKIYHLFKIKNKHLWPHILKQLYEFKELTLEKIFDADSSKLDFFLTRTQHFLESTHPEWYLSIQNIFPIANCIVEGNLPKLRVLIKLGHEIPFIMNDFPKEELVYYWYSYFQQNYSSVQHIMPRSYTLKRAFLLLQIYMACSKEEHLEAAKLIWRAIPYPFITKTEMNDILIGVIPSVRHKEIKRLSEQFERVFGNYSTKPRSLLHFARCKIRRVLNGRCMLPKGIKQLRLPEKLQSYLMLEH